MPKPQDFICPLCGHRFVSERSTCPNCDGVAKSQGEVTHKTLQGDPDDFRKGLR